MGYMNKEQRMSISPKEYQQTLMEEAGMIAGRRRAIWSPLPPEGRPTGLFAIHSIKQTKLCENATRGRKGNIY